MSTKIVAISVVSDDLGEEWVASAIFHGSCEQRQSVVDADSIYGYRQEVGTTRVRQRFGAIPTLFFPCFSPVARFDLAAQLANLPRIKLHPVEFVTLVEIPLTNDYELVRKLARKRRLNFVTDAFQYLPNRLGDHGEVPVHFEVKAPVLERAVRIHEHLNPDVSSSMKASYRRYREWLPRYVPGSFFEEYPLCHSGGGLLVTLPVYDLIRPHVENPYFAKFELEFD